MLDPSPASHYKFIQCKTVSINSPTAPSKTTNAIPSPLACLLKNKIRAAIKTRDAKLSIKIIAIIV